MAYGKRMMNHPWSSSVLYRSKANTKSRLVSSRLTFSESRLGSLYASDGHEPTRRCMELCIYGRKVSKYVVYIMLLWMWIILTSGFTQNNICCYIILRLFETSTLKSPRSVLIYSGNTIYIIWKIILPRPPRFCSGAHKLECMLTGNPSLMEYFIPNYGLFKRL